MKIYQYFKNDSDNKEKAKTDNEAKNLEDDNKKNMEWYMQELIHDENIPIDDFVKMILKELLEESKKKKI